MEKAVIFIPVDAVILNHFEDADEQGTLTGILSYDAIESAVRRAENHYRYADHPSIWGAAAAMAHGLAKGHGFVDGNKRASFTATIAFLNLNGWSLVASEQVIIDTWLALTAGLITESDFGEWIAMHIQADVIEPDTGNFAVSEGDYLDEFQRALNEAAPISRKP